MNINILKNNLQTFNKAPTFRENFSLYQINYSKNKLELTSRVGRKYFYVKIICLFIILRIKLNKYKFFYKNISKHLIFNFELIKGEILPKRLTFVKLLIIVL